MANSQQNASNGIEPEACWQVLERAAASSQLKKATRLKEFLYYVGTKSIKEGCADVHEQEIGRAVFGRRPDYDTSQDNIVRVSASELRRRVAAYFEAEGKNDEIVFEIPRGSYSPIFRLRVSEPPQTEESNLGQPPQTEADAAPATPVNPGWRGQLPLTAVSALALILAIACIVLWQQNRSLRKMVHNWVGQPALAAFWPRFLESRQPTDMILADTSFVLIEDMMKQPFSLADYLNRSYLSQIRPFSLCSENNTVLKSISFESIAARNNGSFGDFSVAQRIVALDPRSPNTHMIYAREYTADSIRRDNVILIGSRKSNPWVDLFTDQMNFRIRYDTNLDQTFVDNLHPRAGEQAEYAQPLDPYASLGYGVVAYLPNPGRTANALIIEGTNSEATNAAGDFVASEDTMEQLLKRFPPGKVPYFEVLLKTNRISGVPIHSEVIGVRTY